MTEDAADHRLCKAQIERLALDLHNERQANETARRDLAEAHRALDTYADEADEWIETRDALIAELRALLDAATAQGFEWRIDFGDDGTKTYRLNLRHAS